MTLTVFSCPPLIAANTSASVSILDKGVIAGVLGYNDGFSAGAFANARMPIYGGPPSASQPGIYLTTSPGARLSFRLIRHCSEPGPRGFGSSQVLLTGNESDGLVTATPIMSVTKTDLITAEMTRCDAGSLTLSIVQ